MTERRYTLEGITPALHAVEQFIAQVRRANNATREMTVTIGRFNCAVGRMLRRAAKYRNKTRKRGHGGRRIVRRG